VGFADEERSLSADRTEEPTPRRLRQARERGQVPRSRTFSGALALLGGSAGAALGLQDFGSRLEAWTGNVLVGGGLLAGRELADAERLMLVGSLAVALPAMGGAALAAFLSAGWAPHPSAVLPRLDRLSPGAGLRRIFSLRALGELGRNLLLAAVVLALLLAEVLEALPDLLRLPSVERPTTALRWLRPAGTAVWTHALAVLLLLGVLELLWARRRHRQSLRMTRDEVRREHREQEGDPRHRAHRRAAHRQLLHSGLARGVEKATVLVVNPTHLAVGLRWAPEECEAPYLVARGRAGDAAELRRRALALGIPVVRDVALARSLVLHDVGEEVPEELFRAAAAVLEVALARTPPGPGEDAP
jgi:type III secretion protein U